MLAGVEVEVEVLWVGYKTAHVEMSNPLYISGSVEGIVSYSRYSRCGKLDVPVIMRHRILL